MSNLHYAIWSIWGELPISPKLFFLVLCLVSIYTLISALVTMIRLLSNQLQAEDSPSLQRSLAALQGRSTNLHQLLGATFYLFGFVFFLALPFATITMDSKISVDILILRNFLMYCAFAANVFFIFLVLHSVQWFVSGRVQASVKRLNGQKNN